MTVWEYIWRWETLWWFLIALYVPVCIGLVTVVLLQKGKGVGFAGAFGVGAGTEAVFGPRGSVSFPVRLTHILAAIFMILAMSMSLVAGKRGMGVAPGEIAEDPAAMEAEELPDEEDAFGGLDPDEILELDGALPTDADDAAPMEIDLDGMEEPGAEDLGLDDPVTDPELTPDIEDALEGIELEEIDDIGDEETPE